MLLDDSDNGSDAVSTSDLVRVVWRVGVVEENAEVVSEMDSEMNGNDLDFSEETEVERVSWALPDLLAEFSLVNEERFCARESLPENDEDLSEGMV